MGIKQNIHIHNTLLAKNCISLIEIKLYQPITNLNEPVKKSRAVCTHRPI